MPPSIIDKINTAKNQQGLINLNNRVNKLGLMNPYKTFDPTTAEFTFFTSSHGTFIYERSICWATKQISTNFK